MQIWLPEKHITSEVEDIEFRKIIKTHMGSIRKSMKKHPIHLVMPKFEIAHQEDITPALKSLGISDVFNGKLANLEPMLGSDPGAFVNSVNHGVRLTVDEKGVEGAAVTWMDPVDSVSLDIVVDKPFYFVISNRCWIKESGKSCPYENVPIFIGRVFHPHAPQSDKYHEEL